MIQLSNQTDDATVDRILESLLFYEDSLKFLDLTNSGLTRIPDLISLDGNNLSTMTEAAFHVR